MKWFRDVNTGKVAKYPARFGERFSSLEEIHEDEGACLDCLVSSEPDDEVEPEDLYEVYGEDDETTEEDED